MDHPFGGMRTRTGRMQLPRVRLEPRFVDRHEFRQLRLVERFERLRHLRLQRQRRFVQLLSGHWSHPQLSELFRFVVGRYRLKRLRRCGNRLDVRRRVELRFFRQRHGFWFIVRRRGWFQRRRLALSNPANSVPGYGSAQPTGA